jgi:hypothetical protein
LTRRHALTQNGAMRKITVPLSPRAAEWRIKRKFQKEGVTFIKPRPGTRAYREVGPYFIVDGRNAVQAVWQDIQSAAVETEILKPWERIEED